MLCDCDCSRLGSTRKVSGAQGYGWQRVSVIIGSKGVLLSGADVGIL